MKRNEVEVGKVVWVRSFPVAGLAEVTRIHVREVSVKPVPGEVYSSGWHLWENPTTVAVLGMIDTEEAWRAHRETEQRRKIRRRAEQAIAGTLEGFLDRRLKDLGFCKVKVSVTLRDDLEVSDYESAGELDSASLLPSIPGSVFFSRL